MHVKGLCLVVLAVSGCAQDASKASASRGKGPTREVIHVQEDTREIREKSLTLDSSLKKDLAVGAPALERAPDVTDAASLIKLLDQQIGDNQQEGAQATRFYAFPLKAGEEIEVKLACEDRDKIAMQWVTGLKINAMTHQFRRANMAPRPLRCTRISVKNVLPEPTRVVLALTGTPNYAYTMTIARKGA